MQCRLELSLDLAQIACFACTSWAKLAETMQLEGGLAPAHVHQGARRGGSVGGPHRGPSHRSESV